MQRLLVELDIFLDNYFCVPVLSNTILKIDFYLRPNNFSNCLDAYYLSNSIKVTLLILVVSHVLTCLQSCHETLRYVLALLKEFKINF